MIKVGINRKFKSLSFTKKVGSGIEAMRDDFFREVKQLTPVDTGRAKSGWKRTRDGVINRVPYIDPLDDGHSKQAKNGMTKPALNKIRSRFKSGKYFKK